MYNCMNHFAVGTETNIVYELHVNLKKKKIPAIMEKNKNHCIGKKKKKKD